jgi:DNA-damage-inducible protein D
MDGTIRTKFMPQTKELELIPEGELQICQFAGTEIRKVCHNDEWYFSVVDVIAVLAETNRPAAYWGDLKTKLSKHEGLSGHFDKIEKLPLAGKDGVFRPSEMANTETIFRIQSIPSSAAEPFKMWLAKVGYERIQEHQNPSIAIKRAIMEYQLQGRGTWSGLRPGFARSLVEKS